MTNLCGNLTCRSLARRPITERQRSTDRAGPSRRRSVERRDPGLDGNAVRGTAPSADDTVVVPEKPVEADTPVGNRRAGSRQKPKTEPAEPRRFSGRPRRPGALTRSFFPFLVPDCQPRRKKHDAGPERPTVPPRCPGHDGRLHCPRRRGCASADRRSSRRGSRIAGPTAGRAPTRAERALRRGRGRRTSGAARLRSRRGRRPLR